MQLISNKRTGFTIVELLIVIVVIGILAAITLAAYRGIQKSAAESSIKSNLRQASTVLEIDNQLSGAYPASLELAYEGKGLSGGDSVGYQYTYTAADNTYCLTAISSNARASSYHITNTATTPVAGSCPGHSEAGEINLVKNGRGDLGDNTNFSSFTYDASDAPTLSQGSFALSIGSYAFRASDENIPVDPSRKYILRGWAKQNTPGVTDSRWYLGLAPRDIDNKAINPQHYMYRPGTTTTLSQPLNNGDTIIHLNSVSTDWYDGSSASYTHYRSFVFWGYTDSTGKLWPPETYTQNAWYSNMYDGGVGAIDHTNNTITLNKPWPGQSYPAGHPVSNGSAGSSYMYAAASNATITDTWQEWVSPTITGTQPNGLSSATLAFPPATKYVRISIGLNAGSPPLTSRQSIGGIRFYEIE